MEHLTRRNTRDAPLPAAPRRFCLFISHRITREIHASHVGLRERYLHLTWDNARVTCLLSLWKIPITMWIPQNFCGIHMVMEWLTWDYARDTCISRGITRGMFMRIFFKNIFIYLSNILLSLHCHFFLSIGWKRQKMKDIQFEKTENEGYLPEHKMKNFPYLYLIFLNPL